MKVKKYIEIRPGAGGKESENLVQEITRVYLKYCNKNNIGAEIINDNSRTVEILIEGDNKITVKVKSQSGVERNININVHKRNDIEEAEYSAHKGDLKEELEEAYKIEKILSQNENFKNTIDTLDENYENYMNKDFETTKNNNYEILILKVISMILLILSFFCFIIFLVKNKSDT